jgi:rubrerythrin
MTNQEALKLALAILEPFKESGLYDDYQADEGYTDERYEEMLGVLRGMAEQPVPLASITVTEGDGDEDEEKRLFLNKYTCPDCGESWEDQWSCGCDDECPHCGARNISPVESIELDYDTGEPLK